MGKSGAATRCSMGQRGAAAAAARRLRAALPLLAAAAVALCGCLHPVLAAAPKLQTTRLSDGTVYVEMHITNGLASPDCYERQVILVNGMFQPALELAVNDSVRINVFNELDPEMPSVASGLTIHWHGFYMWNEAAWYDGTAYLTQCPIVPGDNFTYAFLVDEAEGSYMWHDHATANRANGLQGALIVRQPGDIRPPYEYDDEFTLFLTDWHHEEGNTMAMRLNRPVIQDMVDNNTGYYRGVGSPQSLLLNGKGYYADCHMRDPGVLGEHGGIVPICEPQRAPRHDPMPATGVRVGGCGHEVFRVRPGRNYMLRLINAGTASYVTVCIEGHTMNMVAADALPTEETDFECIDLNNGQRYDVLISAASANAGRNFWISVHSQHTAMAPSTYAVLSYEGADVYAWPQTPPPQPGMAPWNWEDYASYVRTHEGVLGYLDNYDYELWFKQFSHTGGSDYFSGVLWFEANRTITLNITQPIVSETGMIRWAMSNVAMPTDPPCAALMQTITEDPDWLPANTINGSRASDILAANQAAAARGSSAPAAQHRTTAVYMDDTPAPIIPLVGAQVAEILFDDLVEIYINNRPGGEGNPGSPVNNTSMQQHPMHLHGHKFWLLGMGPGVYDPAVHEPTLNKYNPIFRDTMTLPVGYWAVLRFRADNPGVWPFHCHNLWHAFMGQQMYIVEGAGRWPARPEGFGKCSDKCIFNFGKFTNDWFDSMFSKKYDHA